MLKVLKFQIGKLGLNDGVILSLKNALKTHKIIRISVLRGATPTKEKVKEMALKIEGSIEGVSTRTVGFTIILKRTKAFSSEK